ncbi:hypothetical protein KAI65_00205 [Candidatus Parcubacteria bacterium]|nr:hypothetical protein [Candidatus Parcubacteria bacterium]
MKKILLLFVPITVFLSSCFFISHVNAVDLTFAWDSVLESDSYRLYYHDNDGSYTTPAWEGSETTCTIYNLNNGTAYYFIVRAVNGGIESCNSNEVFYRLSVDTDEDCVCDSDEITIYGTDPNNSDTDRDGIDDGTELSYWGSQWCEDIDGDGVINLLDFDSDGDGFSDGTEYYGGYDAGDAEDMPVAEKIYFEAESGYIQHPMVATSDSTASSGRYIVMPDSSASGGYAEYIFDVASPGNYIVWGLAIATSEYGDSFYVSMDYGEDIRWDVVPGYYNIWGWDQAGSASNGDPIIFYLDAGEHTLIVKQRERWTKLDKILVTNNPNYAPTEQGE